MYKLERALVSAQSEIDYYLRRPKNGEPLIILLHGFGETLGHILRHFEHKLPEKFGILAINGIFPLPQKKFDSPEWKLRFCWYFYDALKKEYFIDQRYPAEAISNLMSNLNLNQCKKVIIGFSQGGYLAPFLGEKLDNVTKCIAINAEYKYLMLSKLCSFTIINICGEKDEVVDPKNCKNSHQEMIKKGNRGEFHLVKNAGHQINVDIVDTVLKCIDISNS